MGVRSAPLPECPTISAHAVQRNSRTGRLLRLGVVPLPAGVATPVAFFIDPRVVHTLPASTLECVPAQIHLALLLIHALDGAVTDVRRNLRDFNASVARYVPSTYVPESEQGEQAELRCRPPRVRAPRGVRSP